MISHEFPCIFHSLNQKPMHLPLNHHKIPSTSSENQLPIFWYQLNEFPAFLSIYCRIPRDSFHFPRVFPGFLGPHGSLHLPEVGMGPSTTFGRGCPGEDLRWTNALQNLSNFPGSRLRLEAPRALGDSFGKKCLESC